MNIDGELVEFVPSFTYLGSIISADGSIEAEITSRIGKAGGAMKRLSNAPWKRRCISRQTKLRMYRALVFSVLLYGSETWNLTIRDCNRLNAFDMSCVRRLENVKLFNGIIMYETALFDNKPNYGSFLVPLCDFFSFRFANFKVGKINFKVGNINF